MSIINKSVFFFSPSTLSDVRIEVIMPSAQNETELCIEVKYTLSDNLVKLQNRLMIKMLYLICMYNKNK